MISRKLKQLQLFIIAASDSILEKNNWVGDIINTVKCMGVNYQYTRTELKELLALPLSDVFGTSIPIIKPTVASGKTFNTFETYYPPTLCNDFDHIYSVITYKVGYNNSRMFQNELFFETLKEVSEYQTKCVNEMTNCITIVYALKIV